MFSHILSQVQQKAEDYLNDNGADSLTGAVCQMVLGEVDKKRYTNIRKFKPEHTSKGSRSTLANGRY